MEQGETPHVHVAAAQVAHEEKAPQLRLVVPRQMTADSGVDDAVVARSPLLKAFQQHVRHHVTYSEELRECYYYQQQKQQHQQQQHHLEGDVAELGDDDEAPWCMCNSIRPMVRCGSSQRIEHLREKVGDFGIALFAPLLDLEEQHRGDSSDCAPRKGISSSSTTLQTEPESDHYRSEDEDYDEEEPSPVQVVAEPDAHLLACPRILSEAQMQSLKEHLPEAVRDNPWDRCFAIGLHGDSFCSLLQKCAGYKYSIVAIRTVSGEILGGFASEEWRIRDEKWQSRHAYYGTGQSFVFASHPVVSNGSNGQDAELTRCLKAYGDDVEQLCVYKWTGENDYCQICDSEKRILCMGGAGEFGWIVSDDFTTGQTGPCATFGNPPLAQPATFQIADFEIYGLAAPVFGFGSSYDSAFFMEHAS